MSSRGVSELNPVELQVIFDHLEDAVFLIDPDTSNILWCNRAAYEEIGYQKHEILHQSVLSLQAHVTGLPQWHDVAEVIRSKKSFTFIGSHRHKEGGDISVEVITTHFEHQQQSYFLSLARNIGRRLQRSEELQNRNHRVLFALNNSTDGLWEWEVQTGTVAFSPQLKTMLGYGPDEMVPSIETWSGNIHPEDLTAVMHSINQHLEGHRSRYEHEYRIRNRNGHYLWVRDRGQVCEHDEDGNPIFMVGMVHNISELKKMESQLEGLASHDYLTALPNRRYGESKASQMLLESLRQNQTMCLAMIDLDRFKHVNDLYGHYKGDQVLIFCAQLFKRHIRSTDFIYRWGGEEFICLFPNTGTAEVKTILDKIHNVLTTADWTELDIDPQTISAGVACTSQHNQTFSELFNLADTAVYSAKKRGRNQTVMACEKMGSQALPGVKLLSGQVAG